MYHSHCYGNHKYFICIVGSHEIIGSYPATKEQRDQLKKAMTDAGYTFDFVKKELKEIEQKSADEVEPKFKIEKDKWYVCIKDLLDSYANKAFHEGDTYLSTQDGSLIPSNSNVPFEVVCPDAYFRDWTIKDAKDGDILHSTGFHNDCIFIFNGLDNWKFDEPNGDRAVATGYCCLSVSADNIEFGMQGPDCVEVNTVKPATKEQCDILFQKMKEAGYEWDAEKKELKKIGQKPTWSKEDESNFQGIIDVIKENKHHATDYEHMIYYKLLSWFKSLKDRYVWKPSNEQIEALESATENCAYSEYQDCLIKLTKQLKKL